MVYRSCGISSALLVDRASTKHLWLVLEVARQSHLVPLKNITRQQLLDAGTSGATHDVKEQPFGGAERAGYGCRCN
jgi:hypothetical protein